EYSKKIADYHFISLELETKPDIPDWPVRIEILNHLLLDINGKRTNFTKKINLSHFRLLVSLIANGDGKLSIEKLKENLWPGRSEAKKNHRFYVAVTQLRKIIGVESILFRGNKILLNRRRCWVDTLAFKTILKDLQNHNMNTTDDIYDLKHDIENAISTYINNFLVGTDDFYWRRNLAHDSITVIMDTVFKLGAVLERNLDTDAALSLYRAAMDIDNLNENLYAKSMHCLSTLGNLPEAEHVFQNYKNRLIENDRPLPSQRLKLLHQQIFSQNHIQPGNA
ncbi:MAG: BTAD domain-containing putative transcriptional regulator, partial [Acidiferrobacterales bacterium]